MFRLFRNFRKKLINDTNFGKYMLYATGEVIILILGIVMALQVNNWNEDRQKKTLEISILETLKADLEQDIEQWQYDIELHQLALVSMRIIMDHIKRDLPYNDSLSYHFSNSTMNSYFAFHQGALETLKSTGFNTISNEKLRNEVVDLYTYYFDYKDYLTDHMDGWQTYGSEFIWNTRFDQAEYFDDYSTEREWDGVMIPIDFEALKNDNEYLYFLRTYNNSTKYYLDALLESQEKVLKLIVEIEHEIEKLEK